MPSEVSDIKQFIEICRRKDAKCTFCDSVLVAAAGLGVAVAVEGCY